MNRTDRKEHAMAQPSPGKLHVPLAEITAAARNTDDCPDCNAGPYLVVFETEPDPEWHVVLTHELSCPQNRAVIP